METVRLERFFYGEGVTLGALQVGERLLYTCEDGWHGNAQRVSCIPDGSYRVVPRRYNRGGYDAWEIQGVPGRTLILFHRGNTPADTEGCILVGAELGCLGGELGVTNSARAWEVLYGSLGGRSFQLEIRPHPPLAGTARAA